MIQIDPLNKFNNNEINIFLWVVINTKYIASYFVSYFIVNNQFLMKWFKEFYFIMKFIFILKGKKKKEKNTLCKPKCGVLQYFFYYYYFSFFFYFTFWQLMYFNCISKYSRFENISNLMFFFILSRHIF